MKQKITYSILLFAIIALFLSGCGKSWHRIVGNNDLQQETRIMPPFERVINEGAFDVYIIQDTVSEIVIEAESNLIPHIRTLIKGSTLEISSRDNLKPHYPMKLFIRTPEIYGVALSGSGIIKAEETIITPELELSLSGSGLIEADVEAGFVGVNISGSGSSRMGVMTDHLIATISGSGDMEFWGEAHKGELNITGSGSYRAYNLIQDECYAKISGSGDMFVHVDNYLDVNISGSGSVYYMGDPSVNTKITGSGTVIKP